MSGVANTTSPIKAVCMIKILLKAIIADKNAYKYRIHVRKSTIKL